MIWQVTTALKGAAMGVAEVIPGVSGGTIAFITGIYERLLDAIRSFGPSLWRHWRAGGLAELWRAVDGNFLTALGIGMVAGALVALKVIDGLIRGYPVLLWAFFFGLIVASAIYVGRRLTRWGAAEFALLAAGLAAAVGIALLNPAGISPEFQASPWFLVVVFGAASVAICALILPGVSGSFMLLVMGLYVIVIPALKALLLDRDWEKLPLVAAFGAGALFGLLFFSHVVSWLFRRWHNQTLAVLTGFMVGSLLTIWPWNVPTQIVRHPEGEEQAYETVVGEAEIRAAMAEALADPERKYKVVEARPAGPAGYAAATGMPARTLAALGCMLFGFALVFGLEFAGRRPEGSHGSPPPRVS